MLTPPLAKANEYKYKHIYVYAICHYYSMNDQCIICTVATRKRDIYTLSCRLLRR